MALAKYFLKRIAYGVVTLFVLVSLTFFMQQLLPGDPFIGEKNLPEVTMEALYAKYGLDKPLWMQYFIYLGNCLHGGPGRLPAKPPGHHHHHRRELCGIL